jgi:PKD repeat protein
VLGKGPSVGYKFSSESLYTVNLDIISASRNSKGKVDVMPFSGTQEIQVLPKLANILLFINGANASSVDTFKITPNQGRAGLVIDASSSTPAAGATIMKTEWDFGNGNIISYNGTPRLERQVYSQEGIYTIRLKVTTNENAAGIEKVIRLVSQDPIASIRTDKTTGFAGDDFKFSATSNLSNALLTYEWSIMEADSGKSLFVTKNQSINYKFPRMGDYIVKLKTTSSGGKEDTDNMRIQIDSKNPVASFEVKPINSEMPNTLQFDATRSFDPDSLDASKLSFNWTIDGERVELDNSLRNGMLGQYTFTTKGTHAILLDITNEQGKTTQEKKDFQVESLLSVKLITTPKISQLGTRVALVAESKEATVFEWDYGDGEKENTSEAQTTHTYKKSGIFDVRLTVRGNADAGNSNSIARKVYISETDTPMAVIGVSRGTDLLEMTEDACSSGEAYVVNRTDSISISGGESVNTDGTTDNLDYTWKYQGKTSTQRDFSYKFDELGCFPVTLSVQSQKSNKSSNSVIFIKVENALPTFASLTVTADKTEVDPVVVNVALNNAADADGVIVSYLWYYYTDSDPEPQDFRITKSSKTTFVVPKINGKYFFAVTMEDSNGAKINSETAREERYSITLASDNINTPLITLKTSSSQIQVEDEVTFQTTVKNVIGKDLSKDVEFKWDFDGDGFYDETTSESTVKHKFSTPGNFNMKVKALYRGISNTKYQQIVVTNEIVPNLEYEAVGNTYALFNTTTGVYSKVKWTVGDSTSENPDSFVVTFPEEVDQREVTLEVGDGSSTKTTTVTLKKDVINAKKIADSKNAVNVFSYPKLDDEKNTITVESKTTAVFVYPGQNEGIAKFAIDSDIKVDTDLNGDSADDADNKGMDSYTNGSPFTIKNFDSKKERTIRIVLLDGSGKKKGSRDIKIVLAYVDEGAATEKKPEPKVPTTLTDKEKAGLATLKDLIANKAPEGERVKLMQIFGQLQENWSDDREKTKSIIDFQLAVSELPIKDDLKNEFLTILDSFLLTDSETKDDIGLATSVLEKLIPKSNPQYAEIFGEDGKGGLIGEILSHPTNIELNRGI